MTKIVIADNAYVALSNYLGKWYDNMDDLIYGQSTIDSNKILVETVKDGTFMVESFEGGDGTIYMKVYPVDVGSVTYRGHVG